MTLTRDELLQKLKDLEEAHDVESAHVEADSLLLVYIDDAEISEAFHDIPKWYA